MLQHRKAVFLFGVRKGPDHERHAAGEIAHGLQTLQVLLHVLRRESVHLVPVGAGGNGHAADAEILVQHVKACGVAAAAAGHDCGADLHVLGHVVVGVARAVEQPVHEGEDGSVGRAVIDGAAHHKAVGLVQLLRHLVHQIVKYAFSQLVTFVAGDAAADVFVPDLDELGFDPLFLKGFDHFLQRGGRAAVRPGAPVQ